MGTLTKKDLDFNASVRSNMMPVGSGNNNDLGVEVDHYRQQLMLAQDKLREKDKIISQLNGWNMSDSYLGEGDQRMQDEINKHRQATSKQSEQSQKEMADAAYQTIKIQQEMLDKKNDHIRQKEEQIDRMRHQAAQQREIDAKTISDLRE